MGTWESYLSPLSFHFLDFKMGFNNSTTSGVVRLKLEIMALIISSTINSTAPCIRPVVLSPWQKRGNAQEIKRSWWDIKLSSMETVQEGVNRKTKS